MAKKTKLTPGAPTAAPQYGIVILETPIKTIVLRRGSRPGRWHVVQEIAK